MRGYLGPILASLALSGCATVMDGTSQTVTVTTTPVSGARCVLSRADGQWTVRSPGSVELPRSSDDLHVLCHKPGYADVATTVPSGTADWAWGNIANAGIGAGVDAATGAINAYPDVIQVPMSGSPGSGPLPDIVPMRN